MNFIKKIGQLLKRGYDAARSDRFNQSWITPSTSKDGEIRGGLVPLRNKARNLCNNDDYAKRYLSLMRTNVVGPDGFNLQVKTYDRVNNKDVPDTLADRSIEDSFAIWSKAENCTPSRRDTFRKVQDLVLQHAIRDGEAFIRVLENSGIGTHSFNLQIIEPDLIDEKYNAKLQNGNVVVMGVELNKWREPVAYYFKEIPIELTVYGFGYDSTGKRTRIPATEIIHLYDKDRANQTRGISWLAPVIEGLRQLKEYEKAALTNAQIGASKMGFFIPNPMGASYKGDKNPLSMKIEAGSFSQIAEGLDFKTFDSKFPDTQHESFIRGFLRRMSAGTNMTYHSLSGDISGINFSSIRAGLLEEREYYKSVQKWFEEGVLIPVYEKWLKWSLSQGLINLIDSTKSLPLAKHDKFNKPVWTGRRWPWVDPQSDAQSSLLMVASGLKSRSEIAAETGSDLEEIFIQLNKEDQMIKKFGLTLTTSINQPQQPMDKPKDTANNGDTKNATIK